MDNGDSLYLPAGHSMLPPTLPSSFERTVATVVVGSKNGAGVILGF